MNRRNYRGFKIHMGPGVGPARWLGMAQSGTVVLPSPRATTGYEQEALLRGLVDAWHDERQWIEQRAAELAIVPWTTSNRWTDDEKEGLGVACLEQDLSHGRWTREHEAGWLAYVIWETP